MIDHHKLVDLYADAGTYARLFEAFGYCFRPRRAVPMADCPPSADQGRRGLCGRRPGRRTDDSAVCADSRQHSFPRVPYRASGLFERRFGLPPAAVEAIKGAELLVVDALQYKPHPSHFRCPKLSNGSSGLACLAPS